MKRALAALALTAILTGFASLQMPAARAVTTQPSATWTVDQDLHIISVLVGIEIYAPGCRICGEVTQELADRIKSQIESIWNRGYSYRCYRLVFTVDIKLGTHMLNIVQNRFGVRMDSSPASVRSFVAGVSEGGPWNSNDPADSVVPANSDERPTTWATNSPYSPETVYAHEFGHFLGLSDAYDHATNLPYPGAPNDLMSTASDTIDQTTIDRAVERNRNNLTNAEGNNLSLDDLKCDLQIHAKTVQDGYSGFPLVAGGTFDAEAEFTILTKSTTETSLEGTGSLETELGPGWAVGHGQCPPGHYTTPITVHAELQGAQVSMWLDTPPAPNPFVAPGFQCSDVPAWQMAIPRPGNFVVTIPAAPGDKPSTYTFIGSIGEFDCPNDAQPNNGATGGSYLTCTWNVEITLALASD